MIGMRLYMLQRLSALLLAPLVIGRLITMIYAVQNGLSAAEILGRTQGSIFWGLFYGLFVCAVSVHAAIGLRVVAFESGLIGRSQLNGFTWVVGLLLFLLGARAIVAVVF